MRDKLVFVAISEPLNDYIGCKRCGGNMRRYQLEGSEKKIMVCRGCGRVRGKRGCIF